MSYPSQKSMGDHFENLEDFVVRVATEREGHGYTYNSLASKPILKILKKGEIPLGFADDEATTELLSIPKERCKETEERRAEIMNRSMVKMNYVGSSLSILCSGGSKGCGKCPGINSKIMIKRQNIVMRVPLYKFNPKTDIILSLNQDTLKLEETIGSNIIFNGEQEVVKLITSSKSELELTPEHPLLCMDKNGLVWKPVSELKVGDAIATARKYSFEGESDEEDCKFIIAGYLIADGSITVHPYFCKYDEVMRDDFKKAISSFDSKLITKDVIRDGRIVGSRPIGKRGHKNSLRNWLREINLFGKKSADKFIPEFVFAGTNEQKKLFLSRLFTCDGSIEMRSISYYSISKQLIDDVKQLLLFFGIHSRIRNKVTTCNGKLFDSFVLSISGKNVRYFAKEIGMFGQEEKMMRFIARNGKKISNDNVNLIPQVVWKIVQTEMDKMPEFEYAPSKHKWTFDKYAKYIKTEIDRVGTTSIGKLKGGSTFQLYQKTWGFVGWEHFLEYIGVKGTTVKWTKRRVLYELREYLKNNPNAVISDVIADYPTLYRGYFKYVKFKEFEGWDDVKKQALELKITKYYPEPTIDNHPEDTKIKSKFGWKSLAKELKYKQSLKSATEYRPSRKKIMKIAKVLNSEKLKAIASSDIFWDEIKSIEPAGKVEVCDIEVPSHHNFIVDNFIIHNSVLMGGIAMDYISQFNDVLAIDPNWEVHFRGLKNIKDHSLFESMNLQPIGHKNIEILTPYFCSSGDPKSDKRVFQYDSSSLTVGDFTTAVSTGMDDNTIARLNNYVYDYLESQGSEDLGRVNITELKMPPTDELLAHITMVLGENKVRTDRVVRQIRNLIYSSVLGTQAPSVDIVGLMQEGKIPVIQTSSDTELKKYISAYVAPVLREIARERVRYTKVKKGRLERPVTLYAEEYDTIFSPSYDTSSRTILKRWYDTLRYAGVSVTATAPSFNSVISIDNMDLLLQQSDLLLTARVQSAKDSSILYKRISNRKRTEALRHLKFSPERKNHGKAPSQFAAIYRDGTIDTFYPLPTLSAFRREEQVI